METVAAILWKEGNPVPYQVSNHLQAQCQYMTLLLSYYTIPEINEELADITYITNNNKML